MGGGSHRARTARGGAAVLALVVGWSLAEAGAWAGLSIVDRAPLTSSRAGARLERPATGDDLVRAAFGRMDPGGARPWQVVHPYLGFVVDPDAEGWQGIGTYGLPGSGRIAASADDDLRVALFGGSVAMAVWAEASPVIARILGEATGRPVRVENFALSAYKQPQQLVLLNLALVRGERFDVVINLDGFNEAALAYDGYASGLDPVYPFRWNERAETTVDPRALRSLARVVELGERREGLRGLVARPPWRYSPLCHLAWRVADSTLERLQAEWRSRWAAAAPGRSFRTHGLAPPETEEDLFSLEVELWERSSRLMHSLVEASGGRYYHFLQPNQYDEGAKPIGPEEATLVLGPAGPGTGGWAVRRVYPRLSAAGRRLQADGVRFRNLRRIFVDHPETLYVDDCCHPGRDGLRLLASRMARVVARDLSGHPASP